MLKKNGKYRLSFDYDHSALGARWGGLGLLLNSRETTFNESICRTLIESDVAGRFGANTANGEYVANIRVANDFRIVEGYAIVLRKYQRGSSVELSYPEPTNKGIVLYRYAYRPDVALDYSAIGMQLSQVSADIYNEDGTFNRTGYVEGIDYNTVYFGGLDILAVLDISEKGHLELEVTKDLIVISGEELEHSIAVNLPDEYGTGFGVFADSFGQHGYCGCRSVPFSNITMTDTKRTSLGNTISDVSWRDGAERFVINVSDVIEEEFVEGNEEQFLNTVAKLLAAKSYLINLGNDINKLELEDLQSAISKPDGEQMGTFFYNTPLDEAVNNSIDYILSKIKSKRNVSYVLVDDAVRWHTIYNDYEYDLPLNFGEHDGMDGYDTADITLANTWGIGLTHLFTEDKLEAERWRFRHNSTYFDNSLGRILTHDIWMENPIEVFTNPGEYRINYKRRDDPFRDGNLDHIFDNYRYWSTDYDPILSMVQGEG